MKRFWTDVMRTLPTLALACMAGISLFSTLWWHSVHDLPLMLYIGKAFNEYGIIPYRDILDMNPPGTHLFYALVWWLTQGSEFGIRLIDVGCMLLLSYFTIKFLRPYGLLPGVFASSAFIYQNYIWGPLGAFQREALCMLPLAFSLYITFRSTLPAALRALMLGLSIGFMISIKPPFLLCFPVLLVGLYMELCPAQKSTVEFLFAEWRTIAKVFFSAIIGLFVVPLFCLSFLVIRGALDSFLEIVQHFWPLYASMRGDASIRTNPFEWASFTSLLRNLDVDILFDPFAILFLIGLVDRKIKKIDLWILPILALVLAYYIFLTGKFWTYHTLPLTYIFCIMGGLLFAEKRSSTVVISIFSLFFLWQHWRQPIGLDQILSHKPVITVPSSVSGAAYELKKRLRPGDLVQPLDVTGGAIHAMMLADARIATEFMYDFQFYFDSKNTYAQDMKTRFISEMSSKKPRFVLACVACAKQWRPKGPNSGSFPELDELLNVHYREIWSQRKLVLYEIVPSP